ncbi:protein CHAPERONE-LIKE PROTEIN OF POR1, chloroplastic [Selaginella moellendorffii]|nr:protein CHAPERONE-LIKE PROTEIN OF POR1, chloroplastic [Selaginella moellendorffii]|eukprot:XP_002988983.2 protein CHAPERONE-LIKE PROTEIN OF POR1, chloroplastic [Selaginella moellendorffii]
MAAAVWVPPPVASQQHRVFLLHGSSTKRDVFYKRSENFRRTICCAMFGAGETSGSTPIFPRVDVRDPYKRLGISNEASEEEVRAARNYLLKLYGAHPKSKASIESAYDKVISESLKRYRRKPKVLKPPPVWLQKLTDRFDTPPTVVIAARAFAFFVLGVWSVLEAAATGPSFQVILSLGACIYFLKKRFKVLWKASLIGVAAFLFAWVFGSFLVPLIPFPGSWNIELATSLISYIVLWMSCTFLK